MARACFFAFCEYLTPFDTSEMSDDAPTVDAFCDKFRLMDVMSLFCELRYSSYSAEARDFCRDTQKNHAIPGRF